MRTIETLSGVIIEVEKGLIHFRYNKGLEISTLHIIENLEYLESYVAKYGKVKLIIEMPENTFDSTEGFEYLNEIKYKESYTIAVALIVKSLAQKLNSKHYHTRIDKNVPAEFFKNYSDALEWVRSI